ncbi:hypothetical protein MMC30_003892 [Trapelia coarctata]|nr:hypothetical protein [Trapelia coarctata]
MYFQILSAALLSLLPLSGFGVSQALERRQACASSYTQCSPASAASTSVPSIGSGLSPMYVDLLNSVSGITVKKRGVSHKVEGLLRRAVGLCCVEGTDCLLLKGFNLPFCYDKFTTDFSLPDGSYGTIDNGNYVASDGSTANLLTGNYTLANGKTGNVYSNLADKPNTSTLTLPIPFTSAGVGSAIPPSALGAQVTYTITIPATTVEPTTLPAEVITSVIVLGSSTIPTATTEAATTIPGSTIPATTLTVTSHVAATAATSTGAALTLAPGSALDGPVGLLGFVLAMMLGL